MKHQVGTSSRRPVIGIMGAGEQATAADITTAEILGRRIAAAGWVLLTGGRNVGVMEAACRGAKQVPGSLTVGILPSRAATVSQWVDVAVFTDLGHGRNNVNVLTSDVVIALAGGGPGTVSEIALALKNQRPVVIVGADPEARLFWNQIGGGMVTWAETTDEALALVQNQIPVSGPLVADDSQGHPNSAE